MLEAVRDVIPFLRADFPFGNGGIGDGLEVPAWLVHGYENPPSDQCFPVEPPSSGAAAAAAVAE